MRDAGIEPARYGVLSNALSARLNADGGGTVIVVAGPNVWGSTSWEDAEAARSRLAAAFARSSEPLAAQVRRAVDSFARGDAAADHPKLSAAGTSTSPGTAAQSDFGKLADAIGALDIDSSMPNASARGKDEYAAAIDCYQDAERRLKTPDDDYQFERAVEAIKRGLAHVHAADQLFNPPSPARE